MIGPGRIAGDQVVADDLRAIARAQLSGVLHPFASEDPLRGPPVNRGVERPLLCSAPDFCSGSIRDLTSQDKRTFRERRQSDALLPI
jgi:hypothetical protein